MAKFLLWTNYIRIPGKESQTFKQWSLVVPTPLLCLRNTDAEMSASLACLTDI